MVGQSLERHLLPRGSLTFLVEDCVVLVIFWVSTRVYRESFVTLLFCESLKCGYASVFEVFPFVIFLDLTSIEMVIQDDDPVEALESIRTVVESLPKQVSVPSRGSDTICECICPNVVEAATDSQGLS